MNRSINHYRVISKAEIAAYNENLAKSESATTPANLSEDSYVEKVKKYIPVETAAGYFFLHKLILDDGNNASDEFLLGITLIIFLILTPLYKYFQLKTADLNAPIRQVIISTIAFLIWSFYLGGWFKIVLGDAYDTTFSLILMVTFTLITPLIENIVNSFKLN